MSDITHDQLIDCFVKSRILDGTPERKVRFDHELEIDLVYDTRNTIWIIEPKVDTTVRDLATALGQVLIYGSIYTTHYRPDKPVKLMVITSAIGVSWLDVGFWAEEKDVDKINFLKEIFEEHKVNY